MISSDGTRSGSPSIGFPFWILLQLLFASRARRQPYRLSGLRIQLQRRVVRKDGSEFLEDSQLLRERMDSLSASADSTGLTTSALVREGIPAEEIVRVAIEEETDLIAVGSRGSFAAGRTYLGSVSKRVIQTAPCPTLTVPSLLSRRMRSGSGS